MARAEARRTRVRLLLWVCGLATAGALLLAPHSAAAKAGALDKDFGEAGRVVTKVATPMSGDPSGEESFYMAASPDGAIVVGREGELLRYVPSGQLDRGFGATGRIALGNPAGLPFEIADLDMDSHGRVVVVGTSTDPNARLESSEPDRAVHPRRLVTVARYNANGTLDASFGGDGVVVSAFEQPPPPGYNLASTGAFDVLVDGQNRVLLSGWALGEAGICKTLPSVHSHAFVARLTESGTVDPTFGGGDGIGATGLFEELYEMAIGPAGEIVLRGSDGMCGSTLGTIARLGPDGIPDEGFGVRYFEQDASLPHGRDYSLRSPRRIAVDGRGRILVLGLAIPSYLPGGRADYTGARLLRLNADGTPDPSFGRGGKVGLWLPGAGSSLSSLLAGPKGTVLLAGHVARGRGKRSWPPKRAFTAIRLAANGKLDRRFGNGGWTVTRFGRLSSVAHTAALVGTPGRLVVGGWAKGAPALGLGVALARYRLER